jgi:hypothetical protein
MSLAEAREVWRQARKEVVAIPLPKRLSMPFGLVLQEWLAKDQARNRSYDDVRRRLTFHVLPVWEQKHIAESDVHALLDHIVAHGRVPSACAVHTHLYQRATCPVRSTRGVFSGRLAVT